jgi:hypothetical protein
MSSGTELSAVIFFQHIHATDTETSFIYRCTVRFKTTEGTVSGVDGCSTRKKLSFWPWKTHHSLQAEICAVRACAIETIDRSYGKRKVYILSFSPAKFKAWGSYQTGVQLIWVLGTEGADLL